MKILLAKRIKKPLPTDYFFAKDGEMVMFGLFQTTKKSDISLRGVQTGKFSTTMEVKNVNMDKDMHYNILKESIERTFKVKVKTDGIFRVEVVRTEFKFDLREIQNELIKKSNKFAEGDIIRCKGRKLYKE